MFARSFGFIRSVWTVPFRTGVTIRSKGEDYLKDSCMKELFPGGPKYYPGARPVPEPVTDSEPPKLFHVRRVQKLSSRPYWEKADMRRLKLFEWDDREVIVRNTARVNAILWRIKHLVEITPIKLPEGFQGDPNGCPTYRTQILDNGEFKVPEKLVEADDVDRCVEDPNAATRLDRVEMQRWLINQWYQSRNP